MAVRISNVDATLNWNVVCVFLASWLARSYEGFGSGVGE
jgi:hypothetical protein